MKNLNIIGAKCYVSSNDELFQPNNWHSRLAYLFISLKNPLFDWKLISWFINVCDKFFDRGFICVVDEPYYHNLVADYGPSPVPPESIDKLHKLTFQKQRKAQKALNRNADFKVQLAPWSLLSSYTPQWMKKEVQIAFQMKGLLYSLVLHQVALSRSLPHKEDVLERYAGFVLNELPILIYAYYTYSQGVVDFYPGENSKIYTAIEQNRLSVELPQITQFMHLSKPYVHVNVQVNINNEK